MAFNILHVLITCAKSKLFERYVYTQPHAYKKVDTVLSVNSALFALLHIFEHIISDTVPMVFGYEKKKKKKNVLCAQECALFARVIVVNDAHSRNNACETLMLAAVRILMLLHKIICAIIVSDEPHPVVETPSWNVQQKAIVLLCCVFFLYKYVC